jgi:hypothetical protein
MTESRSGAELVRLALAAAKTPEEREVAWQAASQAAHEISLLLHRHWARRGRRGGLDPITVARQHAIRELHAATVNSTMPMPPHLAFLLPSERRLCQEELRTARRLSAKVVRQSLRPLPG